MINLLVWFFILTGVCFAQYGQGPFGDSDAVKTIAQSASGFKQSGTKVILNTASSNVGIGSATPNSKLTIMGSDTGTTPALNIGDSAGTLRATFLNNGTVGLGTTDPIGGNGQYVFNVFQNVNGLRMLVAKNPNAGSNAAMGFEVQTADTNAFLRSYPSGSNNSIGGGRSVLNSETGTGLTLVATNGDVRFVTGAGATEAVRILNGGNVGIGSITPGMKLDVQGTMRASLGIINTAATAGAIVCSTSTGAWGHCTSSASCTSTCTCTCVAN